MLSVHVSMFSRHWCLCSSFNNVYVQCFKCLLVMFIDAVPSWYLVSLYGNCLPALPFIKCLVSLWFMLSEFYSWFRLLNKTLFIGRKEVIQKLWHEHPSYAFILMACLCHEYQMLIMFKWFGFIRGGELSLRMHLLETGFGKLIYGGLFRLI